MESIPHTFTLDRFVGQQLQEVGIGGFCLQFRFQGPDVISCEGDVFVVTPTGEMPIFDGEPANLNLLKPLLGETVESWKIESSHGFSVILSQGHKILFRSKDHPYEDFVIRPEIQIV